MLTTQWRLGQRRWRGAKLHMSRENADEAIVSVLSDMSDLPLDAEVKLGDIEYTHVMHRIGIADDERGISVSAFNSSI
jgi:hypothetical protein